ncbi:MAG TPA: hypothetical protein P5205_09360 [Candidatus Paceibacterota bacterium]|nr:hypothetical protein [Verrucomicrobiota bacterium]HSA10564.1 hypothetical protein [Candidatus Paceibacterota bacterium]
MSHRFYRFGYTNPPREGKPRLHHSRDGAAFDELIDPLYAEGYRHGTFIHNYPRHRLSARHFTFLEPGDLVVSTTRPPLDDVLGKDKDWRRIERSDDHLEKAIHKDLRRFFKHLCRYFVTLKPETANLLPPEFSLMACTNFHTKGKGTIASTQITVGERDRTKKGPKGFNAVGFFLHLPQITGYKCGLIASFSMGGYENLLWNRIVRLKFRKWFHRPVFAFALLNLPDEPPQPLTPELADKATVKVLFQHWLDDDRQVEFDFSGQAPKARKPAPRPTARRSPARRKPRKTG